MPEFTATDNRITLTDGADILLVQSAVLDTRPFIHPLAAPGGAGALTEDAPPHHPWQHGLYVGLNDVNGIGYWEEGLRDKPMDGSFHPEPLTAPSKADGRIAWSVRTTWRDPDGRDLLLETQTWSFQTGEATHTLDLTWTLVAHVDLVFGKYAYGGLFIRMPYRKEAGGQALNSEGLSHQNAEGQRARWVAVAMPLIETNRTAGIAIYDHPDNPEHPVPWRVDGQFGISPSRCIAAPWTLDATTSTTSRHRVLAFDGDINPALIEQDWQSYATPQP